MRVRPRTGDRPVRKRRARAPGSNPPGADAVSTSMRSASPERRAGISRRILDDPPAEHARLAPAVGEILHIHLDDLARAECLGIIPQRRSVRPPDDDPPRTGPLDPGRGLIPRGLGDLGFEQIPVRPGIPPARDLKNGEGRNGDPSERNEGETPFEKVEEGEAEENQGVHLSQRPPGPGEGEEEGGEEEVDPKGAVAVEPPRHAESPEGERPESCPECEDDGDGKVQEVVKGEPQREAQEEVGAVLRARREDSPRPAATGSVECAEKVAPEPARGEVGGEGRGRGDALTPRSAPHATARQEGRAAKGGECHGGKGRHEEENSRRGARRALAKKRKEKEKMGRATEA